MDKTLPRDELREALEALEAALSSSPPEGKDEADLLMRAECAVQRNRPDLYSAFNSEIRATLRALHAEGFLVPAPSLPPSPPDGTVGEMLAKASAALEPFAGCVFNDNGEITTSNRMFTFAEIERAYWAHRRLAAHLRSQAGTVRASCRECNDKGWVYAAEKVPDHQLRKITYFGTRTIKSPCLHCETGRAALAAAPAQEARDK